MKFIQIFNLLVLGITAKSAVIPTLKDEKIRNAQCQDSFKLIEKCILLDEKKVGPRTCEIFESAQCQQLYENIDDELALCQYSDVNITAGFVRDFVYKFSAVCTKDDNGEYCPLVSIVTADDLSGFVLDSNKSDAEILVDIYSLNCVSVVCREAAIDFIKMNRESLKKKNSQLPENDDNLVESINELGNLISSLQTKQCMNNKVSKNTNENAVDYVMTEPKDDINDTDDVNEAPIEQGVDDDVNEAPVEQEAVVVPVTDDDANEAPVEQKAVNSSVNENENSSDEENVVAVDDASLSESSESDDETIKASDDNDNNDNKPSLNAITSKKEYAAVVPVIDETSNEKIVNTIPVVKTTTATDISTQSINLDNEEIKSQKSEESQSLEVIKNYELKQAIKPLYTIAKHVKIESSTKPVAKKPKKKCFVKSSKH